MGNCTNVTNDPLTVTLTAGSLGTFCHTSLQTTYDKFIEETTGAIAGDVAAFVSGDDTPASGDQTKLWFRLDGDDCHTPLGWYFYNGNLATPAWVPLEASSPSPIGTIVQYVADAAPTDWLLCDGAVADSVTYATLNTLLGTTYGTQGQTPDLQCRIPIGKGTASGLTTRALNDTGGIEDVTLAEANLPEHTHLTVANASVNIGGAMVTATEAIGWHLQRELAIQAFYWGWVNCRHWRNNDRIWRGLPD